MLSLVESLEIRDCFADFKRLRFRFNELIIPMLLPSIHLAKQKSSLYLDFSPFQLQRIVSISIKRYSTRGSFCNIIIPMFTLSNFAQIGILRIFLESDQREDGAS